MTLRDVGDLVGVDAGQLALVAGVEQQPGVDADEPARQRERIDAPLFVTSPGHTCSDWPFASAEPHKTKSRLIRSRFMFISIGLPNSVDMY